MKWTFVLGVLLVVLVLIVAALIPGNQAASVLVIVLFMIVLDSAHLLASWYLDNGPLIW